MINPPLLQHSSGSPTYDGVVDVGWTGNLGAERLNILNPSVVLLDAIGREANELHTTSRKVLGTTSDFAKLSGANGGKVIYERALMRLRKSTMQMNSYRDGRRE